MMGFLLGLVLGLALGYGGGWVQSHPEWWAKLVADIKARFGKKAP